MKKLLKHKHQQLQQGLVQPDMKDRIVVPLLGVGAILMSIVAFILLLYILTIIVRLFFVL